MVQLSALAPVFVPLTLCTSCVEVMDGFFDVCLYHSHSSLNPFATPFFPDEPQINLSVRIDDEDFDEDKYPQGGRPLSGYYSIPKEGISARDIKPEYVSPLGPTGESAGSIDKDSLSFAMNNRSVIELDFSHVKRIVHEKLLEPPKKEGESESDTRKRREKRKIHLDTILYKAFLFVKFDSFVRSKW